MSLAAGTVSVVLALACLRRELPESDQPADGQQTTNIFVLGKQSIYTGRVCGWAYAQMSVKIVRDLARNATDRNGEFRRTTAWGRLSV